MKKRIYENKKAIGQEGELTSIPLLFLSGFIKIVHFKSHYDS